MLTVFFPVTCPECGKESLGSLPAATINVALLEAELVTLRSQCHGIEWRASTREIEQIREYLWVAQLRRSRKSPSKTTSASGPGRFS